MVLHRCDSCFLEANRYMHDSLIGKMIFVLAASILILFSPGPGAQQNAPADPRLSLRREIALPVSQSGAFDPSLADTQPGARAWMSYSAVDPSPRWGMENSRTETIRLAYSDDRGAQWRDAGVRVNEILDIDY